MTERTIAAMGLARAGVASLDELISSLSCPEAYPHPVDRVEVRQTHISVVFLAGEHAYKVKKPVDLGFLDFTTLERRLHFCHEEVRLNRRLAPRVYHGVVPVTRERGGLHVRGTGTAVEHAVWMERLDQRRTLLARLEQGDLGPEVVAELGRRVAAFHALAEGGPAVARGGRFDVVAGNCRENFAQASAHIGLTVSGAVFDRVRALTERALAAYRPLIDERARAGRPRDTHGDLHLEHVYHYPERPPPDDLVIVDCIEFNTRFRRADPVADMAFLAMDLAYRGRRDLERAFRDAYLQASDDGGGLQLLPLYRAYRAVVRAKVEGFAAREPEIPAGDRERLREQARGHWLFALGELEAPASRPCLVLVGGLPGTGKSTLARGLARRAGLETIATDRVRKEIAGVAATVSRAAPFATGIYTPEWDERTYGECRRRAERLLAEGGRVLIDATWRDEEQRRRLLDLARRLAVPAVFFVCHAEPEEVARRLEARRGDASDAGVEVYLEAARRWQEPGEETGRVLIDLQTGAAAEPALEVAIAQLRSLGLL